MSQKKLSLIITFLILGLSIQLFAQTDTLNLKGKWALQFQVTENFTLDDFQGAAFSGKFHFNNHSAIRVGVDLNGFSSDENHTIENVDGDSLHFMEESRAFGRTTIKIGIQYLHYTTISNSISMFIGGGLSHYTSPDYTRDVNDEDNLITRSGRFSGYGADFILGTEWFVKSNIGISAEYNSGYSYSKSNITTIFYEENNLSDEIAEENYLYKRSVSFDNSSFNNHKVKFGVTVYF